VILEATDCIGGRIHKTKFAGLNVEMGANWVEGVGGHQTNPIWTMVNHTLRLNSFVSDFDHLHKNTYKEEYVLADAPSDPPCMLCVALHACVHIHTYTHCLFILYQASSLTYRTDVGTVRACSGGLHAQDFVQKRMDRADEVKESGGKLSGTLHASGRDDMSVLAMQRLNDQ
jgi:polyamine oxidase